MFPFVIVTGLSGAGKSVLLKSLEDLGYETIDNPPLSLLRPAIEEKHPGGKPLAIGLDVRSRDFSPKDLLESVKEAEKHSDFKLRSNRNHRIKARRMIHITWIEYDDILESILWDSAKDLVSKISMRVKHRASKAILDVTLYEELKETGLSVPGLAENLSLIHI